MMNKNKKNIKKSELSISKYEWSKMRNCWVKIFIITTVIQLLFFTFFSLVGKLDGNVDTISSFRGIIALSNTVSMCVIAVYGSVLLRKKVVKFYVGEQRNRIFLFPVDRKELLIKKTNAFFIMLLTSLSTALFFSLVIELMVNKVVKLDSRSLVEDGFIGLMSILVSCTLVYMILLLSEFVSLWKQSEISTIISSVVLMLIFSNFSAMGMLSFPIVTFFSSLIMAVCVCCFSVVCSTKIKKMEVY